MTWTVSVPDEAFTVDSQAQPSFDSYGGDTLSEPIDAENEVIVDLTQKLEVEDAPVTVITDNSEPVEEAVSAEVVDLRTDGPASVLPPVEHLTDVDYNKVNDITLELINEEAVEAATTASPVLFTYAPDTEGSTPARNDRFARFAKRLSKLNDKKLYFKLLISDFYSDSEEKLFSK